MVTSTPRLLARLVASGLDVVTHSDDAVDGGPCIGLHLNNRPLLSLLLVKFASSTSPQKPPATYTRVSDFGPHTDSIFRGRLVRDSDLYASIYGKMASSLHPIHPSPPSRCIRTLNEVQISLIKLQICKLSELNIPRLSDDFSCDKHDQWGRVKGGGY